MGQQERYLAMGAMIKVTEIAHYDVPDSLLRYFVDSPRVGSTLEARAFQVTGWVLGTHAPVRSIVIRCGENVVRSPTAMVPRPDLALAFSTVPWARGAGFDSVSA